MPDDAMWLFLLSIAVIATESFLEMDLRAILRAWLPVGWKNRNRVIAWLPTAIGLACSSTVLALLCCHLAFVAQQPIQAIVIAVFWIAWNAWLWRRRRRQANPADAALPR